MRYAADGWGVGELWLDGRRVLWHELPRPDESEGIRRRSPRGEASSPTGTVSGGFAQASDEFVSALVSRLQAFFAGRPDRFDDVELDLDELSDFGRACVRVLRALPRGEVVTYGELAAMAGRLRAARAAGTFCARNRLAVFVPCHRVVAANGIGSYGSLGVDYKRRLLALEGVSL